MAQIGKLREFMGSKSSENDILDIGAIFNMAIDRFNDLQEAIEYIETVDSESLTDAEDPPTLGQTLSLELKYVTEICAN